MAKPPTFLSKLANRKGFGDVVHNDQLDQDFLLFDVMGKRHGVHRSANILGSDADEWLILGDADDIADMGGGNDLVEGNGGNDTLSGGDGNDVLAGGFGADILDGDADNDTADYSDSGGAVRVALDGAASGGDAQGDVLFSIENLIGSAHNDTLTGDGGDNILDGGGSNDYLYGEGGADTFVFKPGMGQDVVHDFEDGIDMIQVVGFVEADITIQESGASDTEIVAGGNSMILSDIDPSLISLADDFVFV